MHFKCLMPSTFSNMDHLFFLLIYYCMALGVVKCAEYAVDDLGDV